MIDVDMGAHRIFALVMPGKQQLAAGLFDIEHHAWRSVDAQFVAHEGNGAVAIDREGSDQRGADGKSGLHAATPG